MNIAYNNKTGLWEKFTGIVLEPHIKTILYRKINGSVFLFDLEEKTSKQIR